MTILPSLLRDPRRAAGLALLAYLAFNLLLPVVPMPRRALPLSVLGGLVLLTTALFMLLQLWLARAIGALKPRLILCAVLALACAVLWFLVSRYLHQRHGLALPRFVVQIALGLSITLGCTFLGILLSPIIREANVLLPVALVAMPIDYIGAMTPIGFTQNAVKQHPSMVQDLSVPVPVAGAAMHHGGGLHPIGFIGPGDILFMAFFFAVALRLGLNVRGTFWWMYGLLTATMLLVLVTGVNIAALIPMGLAVLIANWRFFKLKREEVFATIYAAGLVLVLVSGFYLYSHSHFFRPQKMKIEGDDHAHPIPARAAPGGPAGNG